MIYLEGAPCHRWIPYIVRSKDLINWELGVTNTIMYPSDEDKILVNHEHFTDFEKEYINNAVDCNNSDIDLCEFEGRTFQELMTRDPNFATWLDPKSGYCPLGGEASADFAQRVVMALDEVLMDMMKNGIHDAAAVTHGGVIAMLLTILAFPRKPTSEWTSDNGCGFTITTTPEMWTRDKVVEVTEILPIGYDFSEENLFRKNR